MRRLARPESAFPTGLADAWTDLPEQVKAAIPALASDGASG
jgi:hypothetical protein